MEVLFLACLSAGSGSLETLKPVNSSRLLIWRCLRFLSHALSGMLPVRPESSIDPLRPGVSESQEKRNEILWQYTCKAQIPNPAMSPPILPPRNPAMSSLNADVTLPVQPCRYGDAYWAVR